MHINVVFVVVSVLFGVPSFVIHRIFKLHIERVGQTEEVDQL